MYFSQAVRRSIRRHWMAEKSLSEVTDAVKREEAWELEEVDHEALMQEIRRYVTVTRPLDEVSDFQANDHSLAGPPLDLGVVDVVGLRARSGTAPVGWKKTALAAMGRLVHWGPFLVCLYAAGMSGFVEPFLSFAARVVCIVVVLALFSKAPKIKASLK